MTLAIETTTDDETSLDTEAGTASVARVGLVIIASAATTLTIATFPFLRRFSGAPYVASSVSARRAILATLRERMDAHAPATLEASVTVQSATCAIKTREHSPPPPPPPPLPLRPRLVDMGSGSGELVLDAARAGYVAHGVELNPWLVVASRLRARRAGLAERATFAWADMWSVSLRDADAVTVFGVPSIMERVAQKIRRECRDGCVVCCNSFELPGWRPASKGGGVAFYEIGTEGNPPAAAVAPQAHLQSCGQEQWGLNDVRER